jgi:ribonuclease HII
MTLNKGSGPYPNLEFESNLWTNGFNRIAGIDEAGRGAWAGPVAAAAVIFPPNPSLLYTLKGVRDSKLMTPLARETWAPLIDTLGIVPSTKLAATRAITNLDPDFLITDYLIFPEIDLSQMALVKGDQRSLSVAAASVLAKTTRDSMLRELDGHYPGYGFAQHKGYGTHLHQQTIMKLKKCKIHRKSFSIP